MTGHDVPRGAFLARIGVLAAGTRLFPHGPGAGAAHRDLDLAALVELLRPALGQLTRDTLNGFIAFIVPGADDYSRAQGTPRSEPGGLAAGGTDFLVESLDQFLPARSEAVRPAASALVSALAALPQPLPAEHTGGSLGLSPAAVDMVEDAVLFLIENDGGMPLSLPVALLLNHVASMVHPASLDGDFLSPFARLSFAQKARAMEMLETTQSQIVAMILGHVPEPLQASVAGLLRFVSCALHEFAAFGAIGDGVQLDPQACGLIARAAGWELGLPEDLHALADHLTGDGWDDVLGRADHHA